MAGGGTRRGRGQTRRARAASRGGYTPAAACRRRRRFPRSVGRARTGRLGVETAAAAGRGDLAGRTPQVARAPTPVPPAPAPSASLSAAPLAHTHRDGTTRHPTGDPKPPTAGPPPPPFRPPWTDTPCPCRGPRTTRHAGGRAAVSRGRHTARAHPGVGGGEGGRARRRRHPADAPRVRTPRAAAPRRRTASGSQTGWAGAGQSPPPSRPPSPVALSTQSSNAVPAGGGVRPTRARNRPPSTVAGARPRRGVCAVRGGAAAPMECRHPPADHL